MHVPHSCPPSGSVLSVDSRPLAGAVVTPVLGGGSATRPGSLSPLSSCRGLARLLVGSVVWCRRRQLTRGPHLSRVHGCILWAAVQPRETRSASDPHRVNCSASRDLVQSVAEEIADVYVTYQHRSRFTEATHVQGENG